MRPVKAADLLELDPRLQTVVLQCYPIPEQVIYQAAKCDYSETPIHEQVIPSPDKCGKWIVETLLANDKGHYGCYSEDTEVMTENGWKLWPEVGYSDKLAAVDIETGSIKFEYPKDLQKYDLLPGDKLYSIESQKISLAVTQDHRMVYSSRTNKNWRFSTAASLAGKPVIYRLAGDLCDEDRKIPTDCPTDYDLVNTFKLAGFFFGDGVHSNNKQPKCLRFRLRRHRKISYLKSLGFDVREMKDDRFTVDLGETATWISKNFSNTDEKVCPNFILKLPKYLFDAFLDGLKNSDGTLKRKTWAYDSTNLDALELVQAACHLNGMSATVTLNHPNVGVGHENHKPCWRLHISSLYPIARFEVHQRGRTKGTEKLISYTGKVYCATVSTGALLVRRNRRPIISGNCIEHPAITLSVSGYVHSVMVQGRTHRISSWDCQSNRYTGDRVVKVAKGELPVEDVFYVRPAGHYTNRQGKKYDWTEEHRQRKLERIFDECIEYADYYGQGMAEEHIRDYLPQAIRQNFVVSFNLRSVLHFMDLRAKMDAQLEIQALCAQIAPLLEQWTPNVWKYYEEKRLHKGKLAP